MLGPKSSDSGPNLGPILGSAEWPPFAVRVFISCSGGLQKKDPIFALFMSPEATAVWQWFHFLQGQAPADRPSVHFRFIPMPRFHVVVDALTLKNLGV